MKPSVEEFANTLRRAQRVDLTKAMRSLASDETQRSASPAQLAGRRSELLDRYSDPSDANRQLERVLKGNDLTDVAYLVRGLHCARAVCRIEIRRAGRRLGFGTGFLVAPDVVMTNQHVLETASDAGGSLAQFGYERNLHGIEPQPVEFRILATPKPIIFKELDFALAKVEPTSLDGRPLDAFGWLRLNPQPGKAFVGEYLTIIQHPGGEPKQICVRENKLIKYDDNGPYVWYQTDTTGGSSGSPAFNNDWEVVALHHSAVPRTQRLRGKDVWIATNGEPWTSDMGDDRVQWIANEGVRISRILEYLTRHHASDPLARAVLETRPAAVSESALDPDAWPSCIRTVLDADGGMRVRIPLEIGIRSLLGETDERRRGADRGRDGSSDADARVDFDFGGPTTTEAVKIDPDYGKRPGYQPKFLGTTKHLAVPLPKLTKGAADLLKIKKSSELKYWNYSVLFHKTRHLAVLSAANVDPALWSGKRDADGDTWFEDKRVDPKLQVGRSFYKKQSTFEADRSKTPFDQGHLTRRKDVQWGDTAKEAKRNGDDSFHYTNCVPQHWAFNQRSKINGIWWRLEEYAATASGNERFSLFNGPIFDAPLCTEVSGGALRLNPKGKRVKDGTFGGVRIPKQYFKVFAYRSDDRLRAAAFIVTQEDLLTTIDRYYPEEKKPLLTELEIRLYQVPVATVARLTNLDFGPLETAALPNEAFAPDDDGSPITDPSELRF